jgi:hypothetical protein
MSNREFALRVDMSLETGMSVVEAVNVLVNGFTKQFNSTLVNRGINIFDKRSLPEVNILAKKTDKDWREIVDLVAIYKPFVKLNKDAFIESMWHLYPEVMNKIELLTVNLN